MNSSQIIKHKKHVATMYKLVIKFQLYIIINVYVFLR